MTGYTEGIPLCLESRVIGNFGTYVSFNEISRLLAMCSKATNGSGLNLCFLHTPPAFTI